MVDTRGYYKIKKYCSSKLSQNFEIESKCKSKLETLNEVKTIELGQFGRDKDIKL